MGGCLAPFANLIKKTKTESHWSDRGMRRGFYMRSVSKTHLIPYYLFTLLLTFWQSPSICLVFLVLNKSMWIQCRKCKDSNHMSSAQRNSDISKKLKAILTSVIMWKRITAAPHWALKGLSRKWMFWLNSSHFKNSCGDKRWAEPKGAYVGQNQWNFQERHHSRNPAGTHK